jgi:hypothetical protein
MPPHINGGKILSNFKRQMPTTYHSVERRVRSGDGFAAW